MEIKRGKKFVCLMSGALIGETVISHPLTGNIGNDLLGGLCGGFSAAVLALITKWLVEKYRTSTFKNKRITDSFLLISIIVISVCTAFVCSLAFSKYAAKVMLDIKSLILPLISFLALALFVLRGREELLLKLGTLLFPLAAVFMLAVFAFSVGYIQPKYLALYRTPELAGFFSSFISVGGSLYAAFIPLLFIGRQMKKRHFVYGFLFGGGLVLLALVNTLGIFGAEFAATLSFPYSYAVSTASMGKIFSRMDPFLYAAAFFTCLLKVAACLLAAYLAIKKLITEIFLEKNKLSY